MNVCLDCNTVVFDNEWISKYCKWLECFMEKHPRNLVEFPRHLRINY